MEEQENQDFHSEQSIDTQERVNEEQAAKSEASKEFSITYRISEADLYRFHLWMSRDQFTKSAKRAKIMAIIELVFGGAYLVSMAFTPGSGTMVQYLLAALLMGMGVYGLAFQAKIFDRQLRKAVVRQHADNGYFNSDITVDFYPDKVIEQFQEKRQENLWSDMQKICAAEWACIIMLGAKRCMLMPTEQMAQEQLEQLREYLHRVCDAEKIPEETL